MAGKKRWKKLAAVGVISAFALAGFAAGVSTGLVNSSQQITTKSSVKPVKTNLIAKTKNTKSSAIAKHSSLATVAPQSNIAGNASVAFSLTTTTSPYDFSNLKFNFGNAETDYLKFATASQFLNAISISTIGTFLNNLQSLGTAHSSFNWNTDASYSNFGAIINNTNNFTDAATVVVLITITQNVKNLNSTLLNFLFQNDVPTLNNGDSFYLTLTINNFALALTTSDWNLLSNSTLNIAYPALSYSTQLSQQKVEIWQILTPWVFNSANAASAEITNNTDSDFVNYLIAMLFYSADANILTDNNGAIDFNGYALPVAVNFNLSQVKGLGTANLSSLILPDFSVQNITNDYLVYPNGDYLAPASKTLASFNTQAVTPYSSNLNVVNLTYIYTNPTVSTNLNAQNLAPNNLWTMTPEQILADYATTGLTATLSPYYASLFNAAGSNINSITPIALNTSALTFIPTKATYNSILPLKLTISGNRFIAFKNGWTTNNNSTGTDTYFAPTTIYNNLLLANIQTGLLSTTNSVNFNIIYLYNLNSDWMLNSVNLLTDDTFDLMHKTANELMNVSSATWAEYLAELLDTTNKTHTTDLLWYGAPANIGIGESGYQVAWNNHVLELKIPIVNDANYLQLVNGIKIAAKSTGYVWVPIQYYTQVVNSAWFIILGVFSVILVFVLFFIYVYYYKRKGYLTYSAYKKQLDKWRIKNEKQTKDYDKQSLILDDVNVKTKKKTKKIREKSAHLKKKHFWNKKHSK